jgi:hypothetical protein
MMMLAPAPLLAQFYSGRALLRNEGGTWLNQSPAPPVIAIFADSLVQTQAGHTARIEAEGSTVLIGPETVVQFQGEELALDHGTLHVDSSTELRVLIGCVTVVPVNSQRTLFDVTNVDGKVKVSALKSDAKIHLHTTAHRTKQSSSSDSIVHEGEEKTRSEHCGGGFIRPVTGTSMNVGWLDTAAAKFGAGVIVIGVTACILLCFNDDPISPWKP